MLDSRGRRFGLSDSLILIAATAFGLAPLSITAKQLTPARFALPTGTAAEWGPLNSLAPLHPLGDHPRHPAADQLGTRHGCPQPPSPEAAPGPPGPSPRIRGRPGRPRGVGQHRPERPRTEAERSVRDRRYPVFRSVRYDGRPGRLDDHRGLAVGGDRRPLAAQSGMDRPARMCDRCGLARPLPTPLGSHLLVAIRMDVRAGQELGIAAIDEQIERPSRSAIVIDEV